jgi:phospholipid transport system substrate-binding protein
MNRQENMMGRVARIGLLVFLLAWSGLAHAGEPSDQLKGSIDQIIALVADAALKTPENKLERRNRIFRVVEDRFDFSEMSKRSLGESWNQLSEPQRNEFEVAFARLLESTYISKIEKYTDEKVNYVGERPRGENAIYVMTEIVSAGRSIPVHYSMYKLKEQWLVYDVNIEGVSLVGNYRSQFTDTMRKQQFTGLMALLNDKLRQIDQE